jgi:signal transduction histidine kinase
MLAVLREALSNVAKHAAASSACVEVSVEPDRAQLSVTDDGVGIPEGGRRSGLANLAARAKDLGGTCTVAPADKQGTRVVWQVPLPE